jgi:3-methyladenine DNA glycosylase AlkD
MSAQEIRNKLQKFANREKAKILQGFFKTGPREYGEGDVFLGITVPVLRKLTKEYDGVPVNDALQLLQSSVHEERLLALLLLIRAYSKGDDVLKKNIYNLYLKNARYINNWDLVDLSAPNIVGAYLLDRSRKPLYTLAKSRDLWKRRIAILSTFAFIRQNEFSDTLRISGMLIADDHDLIHKTVGWMLREVGNRDRSVEEKFLQRHYKAMPRTMLRYAIEKFPEEKRQNYLNGKVRA